jgi:hypothetical protein
MSKALVLLALTSSCLCWWDTGHLIIARIAYDKLTSDGQTAVIDQANTILGYLSEFTSEEENYPFVECATFADDSKAKGFDDQADWHFINTPYFMDGFTTDAPYENYNVTWALGTMIDDLSGAKATLVDST